MNKARQQEVLSLISRRGPLTYKDLMTLVSVPSKSDFTKGLLKMKLDGHLVTVPDNRNEHRWALNVNPKSCGHCESTVLVWNVDTRAWECPSCHSSFNPAGYALPDPEIPPQAAG
jgi:hypothetical protein